MSCLVMLDKIPWEGLDTEGEDPLYSKPNVIILDFLLMCVFTVLAALQS